MRVPAEGISLTGSGLVLAVVLGVYLVAGQPLVGAWNTHRFHDDLAAGRPARMARYHRTLTLEWALVLLALLVTLIAGVGLGPLGVRLPDVDQEAMPYTIAGSVCLVLSAYGLRVLRRRVVTGSVPVTGPQRVLELMPRGPLERKSFVAVSITAGLCEEFLYRGFLLMLVVAIIPGVAPWRALVISAACFGLAHAYQGPAGMVLTLIVGAALTVLYLGTGSLLLPVLFHALIDLRVLILPEPADAGETVVMPDHA